jgi:hypothetical protein
MLARDCCRQFVLALNSGRLKVEYYASAIGFRFLSAIRTLHTPFRWLDWPWVVRRTRGRPLARFSVGARIGHHCSAQTHRTRLKDFWWYEALTTMSRRKATRKQPKPGRHLRGPQDSARRRAGGRLADDDYQKAPSERHNEYAGHRHGAQQCRHPHLPRERALASDSSPAGAGAAVLADLAARRPR